MSFQVTILGSNSAISCYDRYPSSQIVYFKSQLFLVDCGEGTQFKLNQYKIKKSKIDHIFISHLHGDHYFGLFGLLSSYHLLGRTKDLYIYSPVGLEKIIKCSFSLSNTFLSYKIIFIKIDATHKVIYENDNISVKIVPLRHSINCFGFIFKEKMGLKKIKKTAIKKYKIPINKIIEIKKGKDFFHNGKMIRNESLTYKTPKARQYTYCSDTAYDEKIIKDISCSDLLYFETTFLKSEQELAQKTLHSTTIDAAIVAKKSNVKKLIIGHFSSRYKSLKQHLEESRSVFKNCYLAEEGKTFKINQSSQG